jgi:hypothetical protein
MAPDPEPRDASRERPTLVSPEAPALRSPLADHGDALAPAESHREREQASRSERIGNNEPVANPLTSPPADEEGERLPE